MNLSHRITARPSHPILLHAVGQGALGIEIRANDPDIQAIVDVLTHKSTYLSCMAERSLMRTLEGGCSVPIGVETEFLKDGTTLLMRASVSSVDGVAHVAVEDAVESVTDLKEAEAFGVKMAKQLLDGGAGVILESIVRSKDISAQAALTAKEEERQTDEMLDMAEQHQHQAAAGSA